MATTSIFVTVKKALVDALAAQPGLSGIPVGYQWSDREKDQVYIGSSATIESEVPSIKAGRKLRDETIRFDVICIAIDNDGSPSALQATETRALSYRDELEDLLADDIKVNGLSYVKWALLEDADVESGMVDKGWSTQITTTVQVRARLT